MLDVAEGDSDVTKVDCLWYEACLWYVVVVANESSRLLLQVPCLCSERGVTEQRREEGGTEFK